MIRSPFVISLKFAKSITFVNRSMGIFYRACPIPSLSISDCRSGRKALIESIDGSTLRHGCYVSVTGSVSRRYHAIDEKKTDGAKSLRSSTTYHQTDRLPPSEWTLIYHNPDYERSKNIFPPMAILGVVCVLMLTFTLILVLPDLGHFKYEKSDWLFLGWPIGIGTLATALTVYRRRFVVRIYQYRQSVDKGQQRRYCIVWLNGLLGRSKFKYDSAETSEASERHAAIAGFVGNYKARNRSWNVKAVHFDRPQDYFDVRVRQAEA